VAPSGKRGSAVSLDPAWSPDGNLLAYVKLPLADTRGWPSANWLEAAPVGGIELSGDDAPGPPSGSVPNPGDEPGQRGDPRQ
jgi:hypothetical protein